MDCLKRRLVKICNHRIRPFEYIRHTVGRYRTQIFFASKYIHINRHCRLGLTMTSPIPIDPELQYNHGIERSQPQYLAIDVGASSPPPNIQEDSPNSDRKSWTWNYGIMIIDKGVKKWKCSICINRTNAKVYVVSSGTGKFA